MVYKVAPDVFYRQYGEHTIIYRVDSQKVFLFHGMTAEVLDCFRKAREAAEGVADLREKYTFSQETEAGLFKLIEELGKAQILLRERSLLENRDSAETYFQEKILKEGTLYSALFELTYRCNEACRHCYCVTSDQEELTFSEIERVLNELQEMNVLELVFTGGDLFVRNDAFDILESAYSKGFLFTIFTNGIALQDADILRLKACHPKSVHFSLYSHISEKHDAFTQVRGSFERTLSAIRKCLLVGIPVNIKTVAMNYNVEDIGGIMALARSLGATVQVGMAVNAKNDGDISPTQFRLDGPDAYESVINTVNRNIEFRCERGYESARSRTDRLCGAGVNDISIDPYGNVFPCNALHIVCGNVRTSSVREIWEKSPELRRIREFSFDRIAGCEACPDWQFCNFCPGNAFSETGSALRRYEEACKITEAKKRAEINQRR